MRTQSNARLLGRSLVAALLGGIGGPILMVFLTPLFGASPDAVLYALGIAILVCVGAYSGTVFLFRRWSR